MWSVRRPRLVLDMVLNYYPQLGNNYRTGLSGWLDDTVDTVDTVDMLVYNIAKHGRQADILYIFLFHVRVWGKVRRQKSCEVGEILFDFGPFLYGTTPTQLEQNTVQRELLLCLSIIGYASIEVDFGHEAGLNY